jgi:hypothetical protein
MCSAGDGADDWIVLWGIGWAFDIACQISNCLLETWFFNDVEKWCDFVALFQPAIKLGFREKFS